MRLAVCAAPARPMPGGAEWRELAAGIRASVPDIVLLNEMPFGAWVAAGATRDERALEESRRVHDAGLGALAELGARTVFGTRPALENRQTVNQGFVWTADGGITPVHNKQFFPNEEGYYESRWFDRGRTDFRVVDAGGVRVGFLICTEVMFNEWARYYGRNGAQLIVVPRATPLPSTRRWKVAMQMAAIVSGCYVASSNRTGVDEDGQEFGGAGWIVDPLGAVIAETSAERAVVAAELDLELVGKTQCEYPCYVEEL